jgi:GntR family transcriptional regulator
MKREYGVSSTTVRAAVRQLGALGLVETRHGLGTFVVDRSPLSVLACGLRSDEDEQGGSENPWLIAVRHAGRVASRRSDCLIRAAATEHATALRIEPGEPLVVHRSWWLVDSQPALIESTYFPRRVVDTVPDLATPNTASSGDSIQEIRSALAHAGYVIGWYRDRLSARPPTPEELEFLRTPPGVGVLAVTRACGQQRDEPPVHLTETIYRSDLHEIVYEIPA